MAPCNWSVNPTALGVCSTWDDYATAVQDTALELAESFLWAATGRRFGICDITVRPLQPRTDPVAYQVYPVTPGSDGLSLPGGPYLFGGRWFNAGCATACCGAGECAVVLRGPVASVDEVLVDGEVVPASAYRVDVSRGAWLLVRIDGTCWPVCQSMVREVDEEDTFQVTYGQGVAVPATLEVATALLACEYAKSLTGGVCALPAKMTRLSRQGVEVEVEPPSPDDGRTGIKLVDDVVSTLNPGRLKSPPVVISPDLPEYCDRVTFVPAGS